VLSQASKQDPTLDEAKVTVAMTRLDAIWDQLFPAEQTRIVRLLVEKVIVSPTDLEVRLRANGIERWCWICARSRPNGGRRFWHERDSDPQDRRARCDRGQRRQADPVGADPDQAPQRAETGHPAER
jgi:hypothetical protein